MLFLNITLFTESNNKKVSREKPPYDKSGGPSPLRQSHSTSSISNSIPPSRKISAPTQENHPHPLTTSTSLSGLFQFYIFKVNYLFSYKLKFCLINFIHATLTYFLVRYFLMCFNIFDCNVRVSTNKCPRYV